MRAAFLLLAFFFGVVTAEDGGKPEDGEGPIPSEWAIPIIGFVLFGICVLIGVVKMALGCCAWRSGVSDGNSMRSGSVNDLAEPLVQVKNDDL